jgi:glycyl-tRNA synthetase beta chain
MQDTLLVEIGVEELPAIPLLKELPNIQSKWQKVLQKYHLDSKFDFYYTPRRVIFFHEKFNLTQEDQQEELFGAPISIAYKDGVPTPAAVGFAKKCGVEVEELKIASKNGKEVLSYKRVIKGRESKDLLPTIIDEFLNSLEFGKSMRWGEVEKSFIRPIRWIGAVLAGRLVEFDLFGIKSSNSTRVHRSASYEAKEYSSIDEYFKLLSDNGIIFNQKSREEIIIRGFKKLEKEHSVTIEQDEDLLAEVVAITEYPTTLLGEFDREFLSLPNEVIILSMKEHQRYFPVFKDGELSNQFVVVSNAFTSDFSKVIHGNEKVLKPRLSDAMFFYNNDIKSGLNPDGLKNILFMQGLGTIYDKELREAKIAIYLNSRYKAGSEELIQKAVMLSKADLLSDMVYEFTDLQGIMGYYYAKVAGEDNSLCLALKEQYLPDGEDSSLPSTDFSSIVALANKLDSLLGLFSIGKIPTGTKDPFALRRACNGVIKIVLERGFNFNYVEDLKELSTSYERFDLKSLEEFFIERLYSYYDTNNSLIKAILNSGERDLLTIDKKLDALVKITKDSRFSDIFSTFKRVANIIKDIDIKGEFKVDIDLFVDRSERELFDSFMKVNSRDYIDYKDHLEALFALKIYIDNFFNSVMVNDSDKSIQNNRKNLIALIYRSFYEIADIKEISI